MNIIKNLLTATTLRPVWWSMHETVSDFGGVKGLDKAVKDADYNIKAASNILRNTKADDFEATRKALDTLDQAKFDRQILDGIYDDTADQY